MCLADESRASLQKSQSIVRRHSISLGLGVGEHINTTNLSLVIIVI